MSEQHRLEFTDADRTRARQAHDRLATASGDSEACLECFQHQASQEPCPACGVFLGEIAAERNRCARLCDEVVSSKSRTPGEKAIAKVLGERIRGGRS